MPATTEETIPATATTDTPGLLLEELAHLATHPAPPATAHPLITVFPAMPTSVSSPTALADATLDTTTMDQEHVMPATSLATPVMDQTQINA